MAKKSPLGEKNRRRRMRQGNRQLSPYRVGEKSPRRRKRASGPHVDYNARLYDPALGRFLSVDPLIGHPGSTQAINPYSYVENNPLNKTDLTGESPLGMPGSGGLSGLGPCGVLGDMCGMGGWGIDVQGGQQPGPTHVPAAGVTAQAEAAQIATHELDNHQEDGAGGNNPGWKQALNGVFGKISDAFNTATNALKDGWSDFSNGFTGNYSIMSPNYHEDGAFIAGQATSYVLSGLNEGAKYLVAGATVFALGGPEDPIGDGFAVDILGDEAFSNLTEEGIPFTLKEGSTISRVWDSGWTPGSKLSGPFGRSYSPNASLPISGKVGIEDRGLGISGVRNNAQKGALFKATQDISATLRTSIRGKEPELLLKEGDQRYLQLIDKSLSNIPGG